MSSVDKSQLVVHSTTDLSAVFPGIENELCNRHSTLLGKLRTTFNKLYQGLQPSQFVIVKGNASIINTPEIQLSMALQNGVSVLIRRTYKHDPIYINGNHLNQELILSDTGQIQEGLHPLIYNITKIIKNATQHLNKQDRYGAIMYVHCNIPQQHFKYDQAILIAIYLSTLTINQSLQYYTIPQLINRMGDLEVMGSYSNLYQYFNGYQKHQAILNMTSQTLQISVPQYYKLVLCKLDLANSDIIYYKKKQENAYKQLNLIINEKFHNQGINNILQFYDQFLSLNFQFSEQQSEDIISFTKFIEPFLKQISLLSELNNKTITFEQFVAEIWNIYVNYLELYPQEVVELVEEIKKSLNIKSCMVINETFLMIVTTHANYTELLRQLRLKVCKGQLKSKSVFKIQVELVQNRWSSDKNMSEQIFTSTPSSAISVFNPSESIWFD